MRRIMVTRVVLLVLVSCFGFGCTSGFFSDSGTIDRPVKYSDVFPNYKNSVRSLPLEVDRTALTRLATAPKKLQRIRLVPLVPHDSNFRLPQYRLFDIQSDGPYYLLGLRNGDVLLAVQDLILYEDTAFPRYVAALPGERESRFLIIRGSDILELQVTITDS